MKTAKGNELPIPEGLRGCSRRVVVDMRGMGFGGGGVSLSLKAAIGLKGLMLKEDENWFYEGLPASGRWLYVM